MNNNLRKLSYALLVVIIICSLVLKFSFLVKNEIRVYSPICINFATSKQDLQSKQSDLQKKIEEKASEIKGVQTEKTDAITAVNNITSKITASENKITELGSQINNLSDEIDNKQKSIEEQQAKYEEQKKLLDKRLVAVYQSGNTTFLDVLLSSSSLSDFISKYYLVERIAECDNELLTQIQDLKIQIENEKTELESDKVAVESAKQEEENEKQSLSTLKSEKEALVSNLTVEEKELQEELEEYEEDKKLVDEEIAVAIAKEEAARKAKEEAEKKAKEQERKAKEEAEKQLNSNNQSVDNSDSSVQENNNNESNIDETDDNEDEEESTSESGFICPIAGRSKSDITTGYYGYSGHTGVDFARNSKGPVEGLPVLAAKSGTVITSKALRKSNGNYRSYGEYIVINHGDGTLTLYAHMAAGSRLVSEGDTVSQGQQIGSVGSTGNSTGPHLHFEVKVVSGSKVKSVNPVNYLP